MRVLTISQICKFSHSIHQVFIAFSSLCCLIITKCVTVILAQFSYSDHSPCNTISTHPYNLFHPPLHYLSSGPFLSKLSESKMSVWYTNLPSSAKLSPISLCGYQRWSMNIYISYTYISFNLFSIWI